MTCWMKIGCGLESHIQPCTESLPDVLPNYRETEAAIEEVIPHIEIWHIDRNLSLVQSLEIPYTQVSVTLEEANLMSRSQSLNEVLNFSAPFDNEFSHTDIFNSLLQKSLDCRQQSAESRENDIQ